MQDSKDVILQASSYSNLGKFIHWTGDSLANKVDWKDILEILETIILIILSDLRENEKIGDCLNKFKYANINDVLIYLKENHKTEALAMIYQY